MLDYVHSSDPLTRKVVWKTPPTNMIYSHQFDLFCNIMKERVVYLTAKKDKIIWAASKFGTYSMKEGYALLSQLKHSSQPQRAYTFSWNNKFLPKVGTFAWLAI